MVTKQDPRWLLLGDSTADGRFIYGVITTGIYCRPGCPSRRPNADNVRFFDDVVAAEAAGFRACKRCHPQLASVQSLEVERVTALCRYIETASHQPSLAELAAFSGWSSYHLQRVFKKMTGVSPKRYAMQLQQQRDTQIPLPVNSQKPKIIEYAVGQCSLGRILAAWSKKGICAILLDDSPEFLVEDLKQRFKHSRIVCCDQSRAEELQKIIALIEQPKHAFDLPLDIQGTLFQQKVWHALQAIPPGETRSYTDIATAINAPTSVRAVASACAANSIAIVIPCHRIVRRDGNLSGYRWGVERKAELLKREQQD